MTNDNVLIAKMAQKGAKYGGCGKMCNECAFNLGSAANKEPQNVLKAIVILEEIIYTGSTKRSFNCHPQGQYGDSGTLCVGFQYAKQFLEMREVSIKKEELQAIIDLKDDCKAMLGGGDEEADDAWRNCIEKIDNFINRNANVE